MILGDWYDEQFDNIDYTFKCLNCLESEEEPPLSFNSTDNSITIRPSIASGSTYEIELTLVDDYAEGPAESRYTF